MVEQAERKSLNEQWMRPTRFADCTVSSASQGAVT
jgi:hypothetical protein